MPSAILTSGAVAEPKVFRASNFPKAHHVAPESGVGEIPEVNTPQVVADLVGEGVGQDGNEGQRGYGRARHLGRVGVPVQVDHEAAERGPRRPGIVEASVHQPLEPEHLLGQGSAGRLGKDLREVDPLEVSPDGGGEGLGVGQALAGERGVHQDARPPGRSTISIAPDTKSKGPARTTFTRES